MKYKAVFFDFDGTLMDTEKGIFFSTERAFEKRGLTMPKLKENRVFIGPPMQDCFRKFCGLTDEDLIQTLNVDYLEDYAAEGYKYTYFYDGILDVLKTLKDEGYLLGVASMKDERMVVKMCKYFCMADYFSFMLGLDASGKVSKAELLTKGIKKFGLDPKDCVLVGDSDFDKIGAIGAGCDYILVNWGFGYRPGDPNTISEPKEILSLV